MFKDEIAIGNFKQNTNNNPPLIIHVIKSTKNTEIHKNIENQNTKTFHEPQIHQPKTYETNDGIIRNGEG